MKTFLISLLILISIVVGVGWFVNTNINTEFVENAIDHVIEPKADSWQFAVIGDVEGMRDVSRAMIEDMKTRDIEFLINVGDVGSKPDAAEMQGVVDAFATLPFETYYVPGNNDLIYNETLEIKTDELYREIVSETTYQSFDFKDAHLILLDNSYRRYGFTDEELTWLESDFAKNTQKHTFLFFHRPLNVPGEQLFGDDETTFSREQNDTFKILISQYTIDRIFNGHLHTNLSYRLDATPVTITGGGGALPQEMLGGADAAFFHYVIVTVYEDETPPVLDIVEFNDEQPTL